MSEATIVFDDDCGFCTWWARLFEDHSDVRVLGYTEISNDLRERLPENYEECSHFVTDDEVYSCGASIEQAFVRSDLGEELRPVVDFLRNFEDYDSYRERAYSWVADNRTALGRYLSETPPARSDGGDGD